jgi:hypothetical protein
MLTMRMEDLHIAANTSIPLKAGKPYAPRFYRASTATCSMRYAALHIAELMQGLIHGLLPALGMPYAEMYLWERIHALNPVTLLIAKVLSR